MTKKVILDRICNVYIISAPFKKCLKNSMQKKGLKESFLSNIMNIICSWMYEHFSPLEFFDLYELYEPHRRGRISTPFGHSYTLDIMNLSGELKGKLLELQLD